MSLFQYSEYLASVTKREKNSVTESVESVAGHVLFAVVYTTYTRNIRAESSSHRSWNTAEQWTPCGHRCVKYLLSSAIF